MLVTLEIKRFNVTCQMTLSMKRHHEPQVKNVFELLSSVFTYSTNNICIGFTFLFLFCSTNTGIDQIINIIKDYNIRTMGNNLCGLQFIHSMRYQQDVWGRLHRMLLFV